MTSKLMGLLAVGMLATSAADATSYIGEDLNPNKTVDATKQPALQRADFEATLDPASVQREDFESTAIDGTPASLLGGATMTGTGGAATDPNDPGITINRFNTTSGGKQWWDSAGGFDLLLNGDYNGFGFYATDLGDFGATLTVLLFAGSDPNPFFSSSAVGCSVPGQCDGSLFFVGFTSATLFNRVRVTVNQVAGIDAERVDGVGFDDLVLGRFATGGPNPVPEPGTLALLGLGLSGLGLSRRRRTH